MLANTKVGELDIELDGKQYVLRPSFEFMQAVESMTGRACSQIILDVSAGIPRTTEIVQVLWIAASRNNKIVPAFGKFGDLISREIGIANAGIVAAILLQNGVLSDEQQESVAKNIAAEIAAEEARTKPKESAEPTDPTEAAEAESPIE